MPTFVPSSHSYGAADVSATLDRTETLVLNDGGGEFALAQNGNITVMSGYDNTGKVYKPGMGKLYDTVFQNIAKVGTNRARMVEFLPAQASKSLQATPLPSAGGGGPASNKELDKIDPTLWETFKSSPAFYPTIGLGVAGVLFLGAWAGGMLPGAKA